MLADGGRVLNVTALGRDARGGAGARLRRDRPDRLAGRFLPARHRLARAGAAHRQSGANRRCILQGRALVAVPVGPAQDQLARSARIVRRGCSLRSCAPWLMPQARPSASSMRSGPRAAPIARRARRAARGPGQRAADAVRQGPGAVLPGADDHADAGGAADRDRVRLPRSASPPCCCTSPRARWACRCSPARRRRASGSPTCWGRPAAIWSGFVARRGDHRLDRRAPARSGGARARGDRRQRRDLCAGRPVAGELRRLRARRSISVWCRSSGATS